jgi:hypothetical protein
MNRGKGFHKEFYTQVRYPSCGKAKQGIFRYLQAQKKKERAGEA